VAESRKHELGGIFANLPTDGSPLANPWAQEASPTVPLSTITPEELADLVEPVRVEPVHAPAARADAARGGAAQDAPARVLPKAEHPGVTGWFLLLDTGQQLMIPARSFVAGRRPGESEQGLPTVTIPDPHKTISRVHARFDLIDDQWHATDLGSANGIVTIGEEGTESIVEPGGSTRLVGRFVLGLVGMQFVRIPGVS